LLSRLLGRLAVFVSVGEIGGEMDVIFLASQRCCSHNHIVISAAHHDQATLLDAWSGCCVHHMCCWRRVCLGQQHCAAVAAQDCQLAAGLVIAGSWDSDYEYAPANGACVHHAPPLPQVPCDKELASWQHIVCMTGFVPWSGLDALSHR
jgi:hypothetical protein